MQRLERVHYTHTRSTGANVSAALSASKLCCSAGPHVKWARGLQGAVSGAAMAEKRRCNSRGLGNEEDAVAGPGTRRAGRGLGRSGRVERQG